MTFISERILERAKSKHKEIRRVYYDRPENDYKFRQKDWMVRRFINDAKSAGLLLEQMVVAYEDLQKKVAKNEEE